MNKISYIANKTKSSFNWTPDQLLAEASKERKSGKLKGTRMLVISLDDAKHGEYDVSFRIAGMRFSDCIALMEAVKAGMLEEMGFG